MDIEKILDLDKRGLVPGPGESEDAFEKRADYCLSLKDNLKSSLGENSPFNPDDAPLDLSENDLEKTSECYGIRPDWVPVFYSNEKLTPWHGGCAWIFQMDESSPTSAFLQLRKAFYTSDTYLGLLQKKEVLSHELSHVGRMCFEEPKFEELIAYQSSSTSWRRWFGPLVQSAWESLLFVFLLLMIFIVDLFLFWYGDFDAYTRLMWLKLIPLGLIGIAGARLLLRHQQLKKCRKTLSNIISNPLTVSAVLYRLTDKEIIAFGSMDKNAVIDYMKGMEEDALRWRVLKRGYFYEYIANRHSSRNNISDS